ncbi:MAG: protein-ADP-ribose hydrolase [Roseburia sp.]|nr:protein-ADP-ribose hydrolase [Roseburia sp.]MCM1243751.1 protein-ADP-ribose hydrolase [Roseburia sp.]
MNTGKKEQNLTDALFAMLKKDSLEYPYQDLAVAECEEEKKMAIRSLMNIRMPREIPKELLDLQDEYLQEELLVKGIVSVFDIRTIKEAYGSSLPNADKIAIWQGDITRLKIGAIVNAANSQMLGCFVPCHRCIDNAIHSAAGMQLRAECDQIMKERRIRYGRRYEEPTGTAVLTRAYNLPCDHVIHTVGPIVYGGLNETHCQDLKNCYESVLRCCKENGITTVAFCCISTGEFHFPNDTAAQIAIETVTDFLKTDGGCMERVVFNVFKDSDLEIYRRKIAEAGFA